MMSDAKTGTRIASIDGLRAVAIGAVLAVHALPSIFPGGFVGVELFFVVSGYLITSLLAKEWEASKRVFLRDFMRRRILRIWPALVVLLAFVLAVSLGPGLEAHRQTVLVAAVSMTNWVSVALDTDYGGLLRHTWSLSAEEQFYLLWSASLAIFGWLNHKGKLWWILLVSIAAMSLWRMYLLANGADGPRLFNGLDTHSEGLLTGCALALARPEGLRTLMKAFWPVAVVILTATLLLVDPNDAYNLSAGMLVAPLCAGWLLSAAIDGATGLGFLASAPMVALGKRSYSLYLWHWPVFRCVGLVVHDLPAQLLVELVIALALTELSYRFVELPFLRLKERRAASTLAPAE